MRAYVMDAFSKTLFGGNQAGVVLPDRPLDDTVMPSSNILKPLLQFSMAMAA